MRIWSRILLFSFFLSLVACGSSKPATPLETFKTYTKAIAKKDTAAMKVLLSAASLKMHEQEANSLGVTVDEIIQRETLFAQNQKSVEFKDEKFDGSKATLKVKNRKNEWETVPFVLEDGVWKIDKRGFVDDFVNSVEEDQKKAFGDDGNVNTVPEATP